METYKTETPPADITKRNFRPAKEMYVKDSLHRYPDTVKSFWIKFQIANNQSSDTTIALIFPQEVSKAVLYKAEEDSLVLVGKAGFIIARLKLNLPYQENRVTLY